MKIKKDPNLKPCPFCGGKVKEAEGIGGLLFFACTNYKNCGADMRGGEQNGMEK